MPKLDALFQDTSTAATCIFIIPIIIVSIALFLVCLPFYGLYTLCGLIAKKASKSKDDNNEDEDVQIEIDKGELENAVADVLEDIIHADDPEDDGLPKYDITDIISKDDDDNNNNSNNEA